MSGTTGLYSQAHSSQTQSDEWGNFAVVLFSYSYQGNQKWIISEME